MALQESDMLVFISAGIFALAFAVHAIRRKQAFLLLFLPPFIMMEFFLFAYDLETSSEQQGFGYLLTIFAISGITGITGITHTIRAICNDKKKSLMLALGTLISLSPIFLMLLGK